MEKIRANFNSDTYEAYFHPKDKITKEWHKEPPQSYIGEVLHRNIHRHGFYFIGNERKLFYDGLFYANKLEGYAQVFYHDGSNFQGLFKDNIRFGPGVFTYPDGEQDVGLWAGQRLLRLGGLNEKNSMPRLAPTPLGQLKLLKYRYLVPVCPIREDIAYTILEELGANERVLKKSHQLYNLEIENKHSVFFNKKLFDKDFYTEQDCYVDVVLSDDEDSTDDDEVKEEQNEESPTPGFDVNMERVRQISEELEVIENKLDAVKGQKAVLQKKVEHCRTCCLLAENGEEELAPDQEEKVEVEIHPITSPVLTKTASPIALAATGGFSSRALVPTRTASTNDKESPKGSLVKVAAPEKGDPTKIPSTADNTSVTASQSLKDALSGMYSMTDNVSLPQLADGSLKASSQGDSLSDKHFNSDAFSRSKSADDYSIDACKCDEVTYGRDLYELEKKLEAITMDEVFFESIRRNLKEKLETHLKKSQEGLGMRTKKLFVNDILAWNNEEYCMRMLKQSFVHRKSEYMVNFKVCDLLAGSRHVFNNPGPHERNSIKFLTACSAGDTQAVFEQVGRNEVNVNVCDAKGNNGIFFAAVNGHTDTITVLVNLGAKLNQQNDEGLFPLSMCFLVFIAEKYEVENWEKSFLPDVQPSTEQQEALKWYPNVSLMSLLERCEKSREAVRSEKGHYVFNTDLVIPTDEEIRKVKEDDVLIKKRRSKVHIQKPIEESIKTLLKCGADPNVCEAPLPPLILSIFTEEPNLVECVLSACTNVNTTIEYDMTGLHVIASLKPSQANVDITSLLLAYNLDPKLRTTTTHWPEHKTYVLGKDVNPDEVEDHGKTPLHILCMRRDFPLDNCSYFQQMATIFSNSDVDFTAKYLGHTPLSLAVLMGNQNLVETIMKLPSTNPHQILDYDMGNVLTIYILTKYEEIVPSNAKEILHGLVELGANLLKPIGIWENAIEFMEKDDLFKRKKSRVLKEKPKKKNENGTVFSQQQLKNYIIELGRNTIIKYIQMQAVENLYNLIEDDLVEHECVPMLAEFLTLYVVIPNLQHLFRYGKIKAERYDKDVCLKLIDLVKAHQKEIKPKAKAKGKKPKNAKKKKTDGKPQPEDRHVMLDAYDCSVILDLTDFKKIKRVDINFNLLPPGIDNTSKYKVCFHCLKRNNKVLLLCPRCQLVYFCSDRCNKANLKLQSPHTCNIDFYFSTSKSLEPPNAKDDKQNLSELYNKVRENCEKRWVKKREEEVELERKKFEEEMKSDTYGIKFMRMTSRQRRSTKTPTLMTLNGSASDLTMGTDECRDMRKKQVNYSLSNKTYTGSDKSEPPARKCVNDSVTDEKYKCMVAKRHVISLTQLHDKSDKHIQCKKKNCDCKACTKHEERGNNVKYKCIAVNAPKRMDMKLQVNREYDIFANAGTNVKKLRQIPSRYKEFIELLTKYFPDVDFSSLFLPYACYSNGHLYYKFLDKDVYTKTYSMM